jgi:alanyl-tRNA synthetase
MTIHLYYDDSYLTEFSGVVLEQRKLGEKNAVILDQTAFYPTSGGQPHDTGTLGPARVIEVEEDPSGVILHLVDGPVPLGSVLGRIDWERRFDHMQQHTGQHILSQAFIKVAQAATVSFHLGKETSTIDIELRQAASSLMEEAEDLATRIVFEDRLVKVLKVDRGGLAALGVRKESAREGEIRVIDVDGFDRSPCGGTHVRHTGEIGMIAILGYEHYKGGTRVEFACGGRALRILRTDHELLKELGKLYSSHPSELQRLTEKFFQERTALSRENAKLQDQIFDLEAQGLVNRADKTRRAILVCASFPGRTLESVKILAQKVAACPRAIAILAALQETAQLVVARNSEAAGDCGAAIKQAVARLGGKGGGKPEIAHAGGIAAAALDAWFQDLEAYFRSANQGGL